MVFFPPSLFCLISLTNFGLNVINQTLFQTLFIDVITSTSVINNNNDPSNKLSQTPSLESWLNLHFCCISSAERFIILNTSLLPPSLRLSPSFKSSWWVITSLLAWAGIAYELRNDITHLLTPVLPLILSQRGETSSLPPTTTFMSHLCVYICMCGLTDKLLFFGESS